MYYIKILTTISIVIATEAKDEAKNLYLNEAELALIYLDKFATQRSTCYLLECCLRDKTLKRFKTTE